MMNMTIFGDTNLQFNDVKTISISIIFRLKVGYIDPKPKCLLSIVDFNSGEHMNQKPKILISTIIFIDSWDLHINYLRKYSIF